MAADVTFIHPDYKLHNSQVELVNNIYSGVDTAKKLLIQLNNEEDDSFSKRVDECTLDNFVERIVKAMSGQVLRKDISFEGMDKNTVQATRRISGHDSLDQFSKTITELAIRDGKSFVLVDTPINGGDPYFSAIQRSSVTNWRKDDEGKYTLVVILETYAIEDGFSLSFEIQYRVINEIGNVEIWRKSGDNGDWYVSESYETSYNFCPFYELYVDDTPPLYDIARVNAKHMNFTSLRDRFVRETQDPILFGKALGISEDDNIVLGVNSMMNSDNPEASLEWVEVDGKNYEVSKDLLSTLEEDMSARALKIQADSNVKTATQIQSDNAEGTARLNDIADDLESVLNLSMEAYSQMKSNKNLEGEVTVIRDFNRTTIDETALGNLNTIRLTGGLSMETFLKAINESELVEIESIEDEMALIEKESAGLEEEVNARI